MNHFHKTILAIFVTFTLPFSTFVMADSATSEDHAAHHDQTSDESAPVIGAEQLHKMRELHARIMSAKTPAERKKLLTEQSEQMQSMMEIMNGMMSQGANDMMSGFVMMGNSTNGDAAMMTNRINQRMDMMQQMMQGLMDQQAGMGAMKR